MKKLLLTITIIFMLFIYNDKLYSQNQNTNPDSIATLLVGSWNYVSSCGYGISGQYACNYPTTAQYYVFSKVTGSPDSIAYLYYNNNVLTNAGKAYLAYSSTMYGTGWNINQLPSFITSKQFLNFPITDNLNLSSNCPDCYGNQLVKVCVANYTTSYDTLQNNFTLTVDSATNAFANSYHWDFGDGSSSIQATPTHTYTVDTTYNVCLKITTAANDTCTYCHKIGKDYLGNIYRTSGFTINIVNSYLQTGVPALSINENSFIIFPNPTTGVFNLQMHKSANAQIKIYDILGKCVYSTNSILSNLQIDLSSQPNGVYYVQLKTAQSTMSKNLIIQK